MLHALEVIFLRLYMLIFKAVTAILPFKWPKVFEGADSSLELVRFIASQGHKRVLIVSDAVLVKLGILNKMQAELQRLNVQFAVYDGVEPNPTVQQIEAGYGILKQNNCEAILAVGGGSPIDAAKMIGARAKNQKPIVKMTGLFRIWRGMLPLYAVPTTAGTGSECTIAAVVTDTENKRKLPAMDLKLMPTACALDGALMTGLPPHITAATGMDALTHAVEAFVSNNAMRKTDVKAIEATQLIMKYLDTAVTNGSDVVARQKMARASHLAGIAFTQAGVGYVHAIAHKFGAMYHTPHGLANAIVMPHVLDYSLPNCAGRLAELARHCNIGPAKGDDLHVAQAFIQRIRDMNAKFGIPTTLAALKSEDIPEIAKSALGEARFTYAVPRYMTMDVAKGVIRQMLPSA
ncbi:iron-containing alcohol dehydrogenase [Limnobacter humi]|uniref:Iron-containing alcohol dehydrogenase n=1 Tax=Limnobacter humi TaxID=1778671 RepID=A0ABT1WGR5_9BURK|nr:iron-containing alcohol dehydrogenase [Limnobacter humi]MCQ8896704.1 iron-containing alcohol dehydrogenase [Limnobacter humi]